MHGHLNVTTQYSHLNHYDTPHILIFYYTSNDSGEVKDASVFYYAYEGTEV